MGIKGHKKTKVHMDRQWVEIHKYSDGILVDYRGTSQFVYDEGEGTYIQWQGLALPVRRVDKKRMMWLEEKWCWADVPVWIGETHS